MSYISRARFHLIVMIILGTLIIVGIGKLFFRLDTPNTLLYVYGLLVTIVMLGSFVAAFFFYKDPYETALLRQKANPEFADPTKKPFVSIILAAYNEEKFITRCVDSLVAQTYPYRKIFVVDDASTDGTTTVLAPYVARGEITVIHRKNNVGKKRAIASAIAVAPGTIYAFTDSDSVLEIDALERMVLILQTHPEVGAVNGHVRVYNAEENLLTKIQDTWYEGQFSIRKAFESIFGSVTCVSGPIAIFRKEAVYNYIPAWINDTFLKKEFRFSTDRSMTNFVLSAGSAGKKLKACYADSPFVKKKDYPSKDWQVVYTKSAHAWTIVPNTFRKIIRQQVRWKKSFIRSIFLTGRYFYKRPFPIAAVYYLHILFVFAAPFIAFRHLIYLPLTGNLTAAILYLAGILYVGLLFGLAYRLTVPGDYHWLYRPLMSVMSTLIFSWLIFYSALTIKKSLWHRG